MEQTQGKNENKGQTDKPQSTTSKDKEEGGVILPMGKKETEKLSESQENEKKEQARTTINKKLVVENWFQNKGVIEHVAVKVGISPWTIHKWIREDPEFAKQITTIDVDAKQIGEDILRGLAFMKKDISALRFWLRANHEKYKLKVTQEIIGDSVMTPAELVAEFIKQNRDGNKPNTIDKGRENEVHETDVPNQRQEGAVATIPTEPSASVLLEKKDETKSDNQSAPKRDIKDNRRRPIARLHSERD